MIDRAVFGVVSATAAAAGQDPQSTRAVPADPLDHHRLRAIYMDLLGRPPFDAERERWLGEGIRALLDELIGSEAFWRHWYDEQLYYFLLIDNFAPHTERTRAIPADLAQGKIHVRDAIHRVALSSSFDQRNPGADTFVTVVMEQLTGMTVQKSPSELEIGKRVYDGREGLFLGERGANQADVVRIAVEHKRFASNLLKREAERWTRTQPQVREIAGAARRFGKDPFVFPELVRDWLLSDAYRQRLERPVPQPNRLFVRALFVDLCGRLPDELEEVRMRNALDGLSDPGPLRSVLARLLLDSGTARVPERAEIEDPAAWITGLFTRLLGRLPSDDELAAFRAAFENGDTRPATLVYALVSHPEYQTY